MDGELKECACQPERQFVHPRDVARPFHQVAQPRGGKPLAPAAGAGNTASDTGTVSSGFDACDDDKVIDPSYFPAARPAAFADTINCTGLVPATGVTLSQFEPEIAAAEKG